MYTLPAMHAIPYLFSHFALDAVKRLFILIATRNLQCFNLLAYPVDLTSQQVCFPLITADESEHRPKFRTPPKSGALNN